MQVDIDHPNAISSWKTISVDANCNMKTALVIETDLVITEGVEGHDPAAIAALAEHVAEYIRQHNDIDCAVFHSLPEYEAETDA